MQAGSLEIIMFANVARIAKDMNEAKRIVGGAATNIERATTQSMKSMESVSNDVKRAFGGLGMAMKLAIGAFGARELISLTDQYTKFTAQLRLATGSATEYNKAMTDVRRIAKDAQSELGATGILYARIARGTQELGLEQSKLSEITETVSLALKASGATSAEAASAMLQLSQAFGSGVLRGQEFNAVNEAAPRLMKALADGMGVPVGQLRAMAEAGKITSAVMAEALPKALGELRKEAATVQTISGAFQVLKNNVMEFVGENAKASGSVAVITGLIGTLANNLTLLAGAILSIAASKFVTWLVSGTVAMYASVVASRAAAVASLGTAQANVVATASEVALTTARMAEMRASAAAASGNIALAITLNGLIPMQARAAAAAITHAAALTALSVAQKAASVTAVAASTALGLLGGPIGWITLALGLGATAWSVWGNKAEDAINKANRLSVGKINRPETWEEYVKRMGPTWAQADAAAEEAARKRAADARKKELAEAKKLLDLGTKGEIDALIAREKAWKEWLEATNDIRNEAFEEDKKLLELGAKGEEDAALARAAAVKGEMEAINDARNAAFEAERLQQETRHREFMDLWRTVEDTGRDVFKAVFADGKNAFEGIGKAIKASVIDLLYQMTVKKWIISVGATLSGTASSASAASTASNGISLL
ncbi:MAG: tape measure protein, partial [Pollutimonas bauzanensis]